MLKKVLLFGLGGAVVLTVGILLGHFGIKDDSSSSECAQEAARDVDENFVTQFIEEVAAIQIEENLRTLTRVPHMATTAGDEATVKYMLSRWQDPDNGLDDAWREEYKVYLSFPNETVPNKVTVVSSSGSVLFTGTEKEKPYGPEQEDEAVVQPYAAYGPPGHAKGKLVYANEGKVSDYEYLNKTMNLAGTIAIVKYGGAGRAAKAINGALFGVAGVLVYTEPRDINDGKMSDSSETYPHSWYLPPTGVERGSFNTHFGDMLTPYLAAKEDTYRIPEADITGIPPIPIQPIGFQDAYELICELDGPGAPEAWQGAFNCTYNVGGPGFKSTSKFNSSDVQLDIYNWAELRNSSNVMGIIRGSVEPDRYVIYGNHRDSWVHGAIDPSSGTAVMLEITRVDGRIVVYVTGKWRPRRSIIFGSWGAEEFGLIGSTEYAEEYQSKLRQRTVAYINVDISVFGEHLLLCSCFRRSVKTPASDLSVYDNWIRYFNRTSPTHGLIPQVPYLTGAGSDYAPFMHFLGITSMDISYTYDRSKTKARIYPAYHTAYDTFDYSSKYIDPGFTSHQTVARVAGNVLLRLADSLLLPFSCSDYAESLEQYLSTAVESFNEKLTLPLPPPCRSWCARLHFRFFFCLRPLKVRGINDQLMLLDRAFLDPLAFPEKISYRYRYTKHPINIPTPLPLHFPIRHVIWASRSSSVATFPGLADAFEQAEKTNLKQDWDQVHKQLSIVTQAIEGAAHTLEEVI
uniref:N-acetylated alpha-linked acidic dipeptidase like 1 n=1 Tax=Scleropages formosus TaxID=113540 RepID=A0A8D0CJF5_SCLFO